MVGPHSGTGFHSLSNFGRRVISNRVVLYCFVLIHSYAHLHGHISGDVAVSLTNERGIDIPVKTTETSDSKFRIDFEARSTGYKSCVSFADHVIPKGPFKIHVQPNVDVEKAAIQGLKDSM